MRWIWKTGVASVGHDGFRWWQARPAPPCSATDRKRGLSRSRVARRPGLSPAIRRQQRHQAAALVERDQVVAAADVGVADEDLRHGAAPGELHHAHRVRPGSRSTRTSSIVVDAALLQQRLGADAVRADLRGVHLTGQRSAVDMRRGRIASAASAPGSGRASRSAGWLRARPPCRRPARAPFRSPPCAAAQRRATRARRWRRSPPAAAPCCVGRPLALSSCASGTLRAPAAWPAANSAGSLTSISTAFSRLISRTASAVRQRAADGALVDHRPQQHATGREGGDEQDPVVDE